MKAARIISVLSVLGLAAAAAFGATPNGKGGSTADAVNSDSETATNILYHGGPVLNNKKGVNVYLIWYGDWSNDTATTILPQFIQDENKSAYYKINTTYYGQDKKNVKGTVKLTGQANDAYSHGSALSDSAIFQIVQGQISSGALPQDSNALYFVLTSKDVNETSGFCTAYCGWHTAGTNNGASIKYSFVGNAARCPSACSIQQTSPNGNFGADAMASVMAHELEEAVTDPQLNAWYFATGNENADQCAWTFGNEFKAPNGSLANMTMHGRNYLIQQNWVQDPASPRCALALK